MIVMTMSCGSVSYYCMEKKLMRKLWTACYSCRYELLKPAKRSVNSNVTLYRRPKQPNKVLMSENMSEVHHLEIQWGRCICQDVIPAVTAWGRWSTLMDTDWKDTHQILFPSFIQMWQCWSLIGKDIIEELDRLAIHMCAPNTQRKCSILI